MLVNFLKIIDSDQKLNTLFPKRVQQLFNTQFKSRITFAKKTPSEII